jgi:hypothetical protein
MSDALAKDEWVSRVLGLQVGGGADEDEDVGPQLGDSFKGLNDGYELVGKQIAELQTTLRNSSDPDLQRIAEFGLNALTGGLRVKLQVAVTPLLSHTSTDPGGDAKKVTKIAGEFMKLLTVDGKIRAFDRNPFGVNVAIAATLKPRLLQLTKAVSRQ